MIIYLNEQAKQISDNTSINEILEQLKINPDSVVAVINGAMEKKDYILQDKDRLDIITFVGGG